MSSECKLNAAVHCCSPCTLYPRAFVFWNCCRQNCQLLGCVVTMWCRCLSERMSHKSNSELRHNIIYAKPGHKWGLCCSMPVLSISMSCLRTHQGSQQTTRGESTYTKHYMLRRSTCRFTRKLKEIAGVALLPQCHMLSTNLALHSWKAKLKVD